MERGRILKDTLKLYFLPWNRTESVIHHNESFQLEKQRKLCYWHRRENHYVFRCSHYSRKNKEFKLKPKRERKITHLSIVIWTFKSDRRAYTGAENKNLQRHGPTQRENCTVAPTRPNPTGVQTMVQRDSSQTKQVRESRSSLSGEFLFLSGFSGVTNQQFQTTNTMLLDLKRHSMQIKAWLINKAVAVLPVKKL